MDISLLGDGELEALKRDSVLFEDYDTFEAICLEQERRGAFREAA